jgi:hypothetical protein
VASSPRTRLMAAVIMSMLRCSAYVQVVYMRSWEEQIQGIANDLNDAGSRGKWDVLYAVSASIGLHMRRLYLAHYPEAIALILERVLATTTDRGCSHPNPPSFRCAGCSATISAIQRALTLTERCRGLCTACGGRRFPYQEQSS